jgi:ubiquitin conjugation factor E4 B
MLNMQSVLLRFAEPFMDATYTKVFFLLYGTVAHFNLQRFSKLDRIDPLYYARSSRINLGDETRIKATSEEAKKWEEENQPAGGMGLNPLMLFSLTKYIFRPFSKLHFGHLLSNNRHEPLWLPTDYPNVQEPAKTRR